MLLLQLKTGIRAIDRQRIQNVPVDLRLPAAELDGQESATWSSKPDMP